jgi:two-component system sensor histidine kinase DegS
MTSMVSLPAFHLDTRVAESPLTGIRFQLGGRVADLDEVIAALERDLVERSARRQNLRRDLLRAERERQELLTTKPKPPVNALLAAFGRSEQAQTRLAVLDSEIEGIRERIEGVRMQAVGLRRVSEQLQGLGDVDMTVDDTTARYARATRQLLQLVGEDHAAVEDELARPMEQLADAALVVEVAGKRKAGAPADLAEDVASFKAAARDAMDEMDRVLFRLRPDGLADEGLVTPLRRLTAQINEHVPVRLQIVGEERRLGYTAELAAFRIVEAALDNAVEHGRPEVIDVVVSFSPERVVALVRDDGEGFDVVATEQRLGRTQGMGMIMMRERAELEGGTVEIRSVIGVGTEVRATFPV